MILGVVARFKWELSEPSNYKNIVRTKLCCKRIMILVMWQWYACGVVCICNFPWPG